MKTKVLFLMQLPPPVHGASMVNLSIKESKYINSKIDAKYVNISPAREMSDLGKLSLSKILSTAGIFYKCITVYLQFSPSLVYLTLSPHGFAFWKDALILQTLKMLGANITVHLHGKGINTEVTHSKIKRYIYKVVFKRVNVIHLSKSLFSDIALVFDKKMTLSEVNNGVEHHGSYIQQQTDKITFLYLSNLVPTKGADILLDAINLLDERYEGRFEVKLVGKISNQAFYDELTSQVEKRFINTVDFIGPLYGEDKYKAFQVSDVFVLPTRFKNECFPLSILEAMSFGLPILSTYEGAIPDIIDDGINGRLFKSSDAHELAMLLANYIDNHEQVSLHGKNAYDKYMAKYTIRAFEQALLNVLTVDEA